MDRGVPKDLFLVCFGSDAHEFLTRILVVERLGMCGDIGMLELL